MWYNSAMTTRTDIHRISQFVPGDYEHVLSFSAPTGYDQIGWRWHEVLASAKNEPQTRPITCGCSRSASGWSRWTIRLTSRPACDLLSG